MCPECPLVTSLLASCLHSPFQSSSNMDCMSGGVDSVDNDTVTQGLGDGRHCTVTAAGAGEPR